MSTLKLELTSPQVVSSVLELRFGFDVIGSPGRESLGPSARQPPVTKLRHEPLLSSGPIDVANRTCEPWVGNECLQQKLIELQSDLVASKFLTRPSPRFGSTLPPEGVKL
jgi:hypothetical protein